MRTWSRICATALFSLAVAGCASTVTTVGPPLKIYSAAQLRQAAEEYPTLPPVSRGMIRDYAVLRKVSRALSKQHGAAP